MQAVRARAEKMLPSSSNTPAAAALEALTAMTLPALSPQNVLWNKMFLEQKTVKAYG